VFTPNDDGLNDSFSFQNYNPSEYDLHLAVYSRWGKLLFQGDNEKAGWNGTFKNKKVPAGTYFYVLEITDKETNSKTEKKGFLTLLR